MTVAFDAQTFPSPLGGSPSDFTHTPVGTPRGVTVAVTMIVAAGTVTSVTYGGVAVPVVLDKISSNSQGEQGRAWIGFLGSGIPTGAQTVRVTHNGSGFLTSASCVTYTAGANTEVGDSAFTVTDTTTWTVTTTSSGSALRHGAFFSGYDSARLLGAGMTAIGAHSNGFRTGQHDRQTTPSSGAFAFGYVASVLTEGALVVVAVQEVAPAPITGTAAATQAAQVFAASGTSTDPVPPAPSSGNRMGGTGAVRKPPR